jgi:hypothetical protein
VRLGDKLIMRCGVESSAKLGCIGCDKGVGDIFADKGEDVNIKLAKNTKAKLRRR